MEYFLAIGAFVLGGVVSWFIVKAQIAVKSVELEKNLVVSKERSSLIQIKLDESESRLEEERNKVSELKQKLAVADEREKLLNERYDAYRKELESLQDKFKLEFENIAGKILKQNTLDFSENNRKNMDEIVNPLREKLTAFEKTVQETYQKGLSERSGLKVQIENLVKLNQKISEEAQNLTNALKSDTKKQGNWGELVLERLLERSGLVKGEEYIIQETYRNAEGDMIRPDVVIKLPDDKHIVIDSKVSLTAYEAYINAEGEAEKAKMLQAHIASIREHVKTLSSKNYQLIDDLDTPDFVLLFLPLESAFSIAVQEQSDIFSFAWERNIVIVSPTTLLATLMTVGSIWRHEKQTRNVEEIAYEGGKLYDKFVLFLDDLNDLGKLLERAQKTYESANSKLRYGSGNVIGKIEKLKKLGAKVSKNIPSNLLEESGEE